MPDALPAVTAPSFLNAARILPSVSIVVPAFTCSSVSNTTSPFLPALTTGTIWLLKRPSAIAAAARRWLSTDSSSIIERLMPNFSATFSAVMPMWILWNGSCNAPTTKSSMVLSPKRAPQRACGRR